MRLKLFTNQFMVAHRTFNWYSGRHIWILVSKGIEVNGVMLTPKEFYIAVFGRPYSRSTSRRPSVVSGGSPGRIVLYVEGLTARPGEACHNGIQ